MSEICESYLAVIVSPNKVYVDVKAFTGRAVIIERLLGLTEQNTQVCYEQVGSPKVWHFIPGTCIAISSDNKMFAETRDTLPISNFAWHIKMK